MARYVALLRALNVGGRYYKMADLRAALTASGLEDVETYIQTGNVRFSTPMRSVARVERHLEDTLAKCCGFDVPAVMLTPAQLTEVYADAQAIPPPPWAAKDPGRRYVTVFKQAPSPAAAKEIAAWDEDGEHARVVGRAVHIWLNRPTMEAKFFDAYKKVLAPGTNRNLTVITAMAKRWGA